MIYENGKEYPLLMEYLKRVSWAPEPGLRVLVGLDYYFKSDFEDMPRGSWPDGSNPTADGIRIKHETHRMLDSLGNLARKWMGLFDNDEDRAKERSPEFFIDFALSENFRPEWLDYTIENGTYTPQKERVADKSLAAIERNSLLKLVIGMAMKGYTYDPAAKKNGAVTEIATDLALLGLSLTDDTIRKYLRLGEKYLPAKPTNTQHKTESV